MIRQPPSDKNLGKKRGRPAIGRGIQINRMWRPEEVAEIEAWMARQPDPKPERPAAVAELVRRALAAGL